jgi:ornithine decarboxylase
LDAFDSPDVIVDRLAPERPVVCARPRRAEAAARWFLDNFPGKTCYAVKANPSPWIIRTLIGAGIPALEVASAEEAEIARAEAPDAELIFMNPVKSRRAIRTAYERHGVRAFALDCEAELDKILAETDAARDLTLIVRIAVDNSGSMLPLAGKFGASAFDAPKLLARARRAARKLGVSFHVGSQCLSPDAYRGAMAECSRHLAKAGVTVDVVNVGGGFPALYPGLEAPPLDRYVEAILAARAEMAAPSTAELWCEPGRALCADAESLIARVELRKADALYLNDGAFGRLFDGAFASWRYPIRLIRPGGEKGDAALASFRIFGPTCDSFDALPGPFELPGDVREGDYVEIGAIGAYGSAMASGFNGFGGAEVAEVRDDPWPSIFAVEPLRRGAVRER